MHARGRQGRGGRASTLCSQRPPTGASQNGYGLSTIKHSSGNDYDVKTRPLRGQPLNYTHASTLQDASTQSSTKHLSHSLQRKKQSISATLYKSHTQQRQLGPTRPHLQRHPAATKAAQHERISATDSKASWGHFPICLGPGVYGFGVCLHSLHYYREVVMCGIMSVLVSWRWGSANGLC